MPSDAVEFSDCKVVDELRKSMERTSPTQSEDREDYRGVKVSALEKKVLMHVMENHKDQPLL